MPSDVTGGGVGSGGDGAPTGSEDPWGYVGPRFEGATGTLVLGDPFDGEGWARYLRAVAAEPERARMVVVTYDPIMGSWVEGWNREAGAIPRTGFVRVGDFYRADGGGGPGRVRESPISVSVVDRPDGLEDLGATVDEYLTDWDHLGHRPVLCLDSFSDTLEHVPLPAAFRFLHVLLTRLSLVGGWGHVHLVADDHDRETVTTLRPLFDTVVEVTDGERMSLDVTDLRERQVG